MGISNILAKSTPPEHWWVKIGDFGLSKRAEEELAVSSTLKGTLGFLAPELHGLLKLATNQVPGTRMLQTCGLWVKLFFEC